MDDINEENEEIEEHEPEEIADDQDVVVEHDSDDAAFPQEDVTEDLTDHVLAASAPAAGPPPPQFTQPTRLTRDPFATFGGVLSGIAHRYGWDVALTRLAFVVLLIISGGTAIVAYFLAWLIIPRATHWPPPRIGNSRNRLSGRDLGIGLVALGALVVLGIGSGEAAAVLVPLALVGGGIWLLVQNPRDEIAAAEPIVRQDHVVSAGVAAPTPEPIQPLATQPPGTYASPAFVPVPPVAPQPVPKRSRLRKFGLFGFFGFLATLLLLIVAIPVIVIAAITDGDFNLDIDNDYIYRPATVSEIPTDITEDNGEIRLDLTNVDFDDVDATSPVEIDIDLDLGRIEVVLPDDVRVRVDADADFGDVTVLGSNDDGINPSRSLSQDGHQLDLDVHLNAGEIVVARGESSNSSTIEVN